MADTQEQSLGTFTPVDGDYFRAVHDPGGSPESANVTGTALKAYLKTYQDTLYYGVANIAYTTADFASTADTTLNDITGLSLTLAAGGKYRFEACLFVTNNAAGGTKIAISGACTATLIRYRTEFCGPAYVCKQSTALDESEGETASHFLVRITGYIEVNAGGTLTVQAAQNASNATATSVKIGSWLEADKMA